MNTHRNNTSKVADWYEQNLWEYMLVANPSEEVFRNVMAEKKYFEDQYEADITTKTLPHITIANFLAKEMMEGVLCSWIQGVCNLQYSFNVALNNFSGFPTQAIFIRVQNPQPFKKLANALKVLDNLLKTNDCPPLQLVSKPHLTIARHLPEEVYNKAIMEYAQRSFYDLFMLDRLVLLKRESTNEKWQHVNYFYLPPERNTFN